MTNPNGSPDIQYSIVLPVYEEEDTVEQTIREIINIFSQNGHTYEIIAVNDGSKDRSGEVLHGLQCEFPEILRVARHVMNRGYGTALRTGVRLASGEVVVFMDCDGQHMAAEIKDLISQIPPYDLVVGYRTKEYESSWHRALANRFYARFASWLSCTEIPDLTAGFRAMRRSVVLHFLPIFPPGFSASATGTMAFLKAGYNVRFVPVHVNSRTGGKSKISLWKDGRKFVMLILRMVMLYDPQRIFTPISIGLIVLGLVAWYLGIRNEGRLVLPNSTMLMFTASITTWLLGLLASQVASSRIYNYGDETIIVEEPGDPGARD